MTDDRKKPPAASASNPTRARQGEATAQLKAVESMRANVRAALLSDSLNQETDLYRAVANEHEIPFATADEIHRRADPQEMTRLPATYMRHVGVLPFRRQDETVWVATSEPALHLPELKQALGATKLRYVMVTPTDWQRLWNIFHVGSRGPERVTPRVKRKGGLISDLQRRRGAKAFSKEEGEATGYIRQLLDAILLDAVGLQATDVHLERYEDRIDVRVRVDGTLQDVTWYKLDAEEYEGLLQVLKVRAEIDITEHRAPLGGSFQRTISEQTFDVRVQIQPTRDGEFAVLRILPKGSEIRTIEQIGYPKQLANEYRRLVRSPAGLLLIAGPSTAGKTTTLYAGIAVAAEQRWRKVITIEDPSEFRVDGITQIEVDMEDESDAFRSIIRSVLRQNPDVVVFGEIRGVSSAVEAIRMSRTGHLVLATLHGNDGFDAMSRLIDLGAEASRVGVETLGVFTQKLARMICSNCRVEKAPDAQQVEEIFGGETPPELHGYVGKGCDHCGGRGVRGRIPVVEFLRVDTELGDAFAQRAGSRELREIAHGKGFIPMRRYMLRLVDAGLIPLSELQRLLTPDQLARGLSLDPKHLGPVAEAIDLPRIHPSGPVPVVPKS